MNNAKHTHGPWAVDHAFGVGPVSDSDDQSYGMVMAVADIYGDNRVADSRLIAAAPDLLEALERLKCEVILSDVDMDYIKTHFQPHLDKAAAAIAKATGAESSADRPVEGAKL